jgi:hypothetical protein
MHRLTLTTTRGSQSWSLEDGLFALPEEAAAQIGSAAVLLAGNAGLLVGRTAVQRMEPAREIRSPFADEAGVLTWEMNRRPHVGLVDEQTAGGDSPEEPAAFTLTTDTGQEVEVGNDPVTIGRHPGCTVRLLDTRVSSIHCVLHRTAEGIRVLDLHSTNGTLVRGAPVRDGVVRSRAVVRVGQTRLLLAPVADDRKLLSLPSAQMQTLEQMIARLAPADAPVLIHGESGAGKEAVALRLHALSGRAGRLVTLNAAAIVPTLAGSELFGHVRGAFTGADTRRAGAFVSADSGTLFLDEVSELRLETQAELLRTIEQRVVQPVGCTGATPVDVRLVCATHDDLAERVRLGLFRQDLYHRICVVPLTVPPLRERPDDLAVLAEAFLARDARPRRLSSAAWQKLSEHAWPGNIRELRNTLQRACLLSDEDVIEARDIRFPSMATKPPLARELLHERVLEVYSQTGGSVSETARQLGLHRATIYRHVRDARAGRLRGATGRTSKSGLDVG